MLMHGVGVVTCHLGNSLGGSGLTVGILLVKLTLNLHGLAVEFVLTHLVVEQI